MSVNVKTEMEHKARDKCFENLNLLKKRYKQHVRDNFLNTFGKFYCSYEMNIPVLSGTLKTCNHHKNTVECDNMTLRVKHHEFITYMKNIIVWLDYKMDYNDDDDDDDEDHHHHHDDDNNTLRVVAQQIIETAIEYTSSKRRKLNHSHINHTEENTSNNDNNILPESVITATSNNNNTNLKENKNNSCSFIENTNMSNNLEKETLIANTLNCLTDQEKNISTKIKVDKKMNSPKAEIVGSTSKTVQLEKTPKQEKSYLANTSNDLTKIVGKNIYSRNSKGETKMHNACAKGNMNLVTSLLAAGFNPNIKDNAGWTPLHEAVKAGYLDIIQELINYGAYVNVPGFEYETPLHLAVMYNKFNIVKLLLQSGADSKCINMYGRNLQCLNEEMSVLILENQSLGTPLVVEHKYEIDQITVLLNNVSLNNDIIINFCKQFNIKLAKNILNKKQLAQMTHIIVPETEYNTCDVNLECLIGMANGLYIVTQNWISDSLKENILMNCENYEVSGTTSFIDHNGPKISRINKQKLYPKLFDGINIYISGDIGWEQFSLEQLKNLVLEFGAKLLKRMPNPEDCINTIVPYHCQNNEQMYNVSTIILYTKDSKRLIKYNMKHLKAFPISWFMETVQKHSFI